MTVHELMRELGRMDPSAEVRLACQPQWAFEYSISTVVQADPTEGTYSVLAEDGWRVMRDGQERPEEVAGPFEDESGCDAWAQAQEEADHYVYIAEGSQLGYLPGEARRAVGW